MVKTITTAVPMEVTIADIKDMFEEGRITKENSEKLLKKFSVEDFIEFVLTIEEDEIDTEYNYEEEDLEDGEDEPIVIEDDSDIEIDDLEPIQPPKTIEAEVKEKIKPKKKEDIEEDLSEFDDF